MEKEEVTSEEEDNRWDFYKSIFARYKQDGPSLMRKCFKKDWKDSGLSSKIRCTAEQKGQIYRYLAKNYKMIREAYKHLACISPHGNIPSLGNGIITEMTLKWPNFIDFKTMRNSDVDLCFITSNTTGNRIHP